MTVFLATAAIILSVVLAFCVAIQQRQIEDLNRITQANSNRITMTQDERRRDHADLSNLKANYGSTHRLALQAYYDVSRIIEEPVDGKHAETTDDQA